MAIEEERQKTPHTALIEALEKVEEMDGVLIIWERKPGIGPRVMGAVDSDLTVAESIYYTEIFKAWIVNNYIKEK